MTSTRALSGTAFTIMFTALPKVGAVMVLGLRKPLRTITWPRHAREKTARPSRWKMRSASLAWAVEFDPDAVKDLKTLDKQVQARLVEFLRERLARLDNPREWGEALAGSELGNYWKYRVGDWRIICDLQDQRIVVRVLRMGNRREIHR